MQPLYIVVPLARSAVYIMQRYEMLFTAVRKLPQEKFDVMLKAYKKYKMQSWRELSDEELAAIPMEMYMSLMADCIDTLWERLPIEYQENHEFFGYQRCREHFIDPRVQIDGPPPMRRRCPICMYSYRFKDDEQ